MTITSAVQTELQHPAPRHSGSAMRLMAYGFVYWVLIVAALEPGNLANMALQGAPLYWGDELLRIVGAGVIGSASAPLFVRLSRRYPVARPKLARNLLIHLGTAIGVGALLIVVAYLVASVLLAHGHGLSWTGLLDDLAANELLLVLGLAGLSGLAHVIRSQPPVSHPTGVQAGHRSEETLPTVRNDTIEVKVRGVTKMVELGQIDWIESQGNYLALHVGPSTYLLRETLSGLQTRLDPARFVRIHRRTIVAVDRVTAVEPASNGDGLVRLKDGQSLRTSRQYRRQLAIRRPN